MKVSELIEELQKMPQDSTVVIQKPKNANGWCNDGRYIANGLVTYIPWCGTIISASKYVKEQGND